MHAHASTATTLATTGLARSVRQLRGLLAPGCRLSVLTDGTFSMLDIIRAMAEACGGKVDLWLSTWTVGIRDLENVGILTERGTIDTLRLVVDAGFARLKPEHCRQMIETFGAGAVRLTKTHAKVAVVRGGGLDFVVRGSLNLNRNIRFENVDIDEGGALPDFWRGALEAVSEALDPADLSGDTAGFLAACAAVPPVIGGPDASGFKAAVLARMAECRAQRLAVGKLPNLARAVRLPMTELRAVLTSGGTAQQRAAIWAALA
jgi:hypothetical protein